MHLERLRGLRLCVPTEEERDSLVTYAGDVDLLCKEDCFLREVCMRSEESGLERCVY